MGCHNEKIENGKRNRMKYYLAPMEGLTGYIYRNAYQKYFHEIDRYFTPFITNKKLDFKAQKEIDPEHNKGMDVVPQILTNQTEDFISITRQLKKFGYEEVNLNLGCPSGTVVAKNRGSGFLGVPDQLDEFLDTIFTECDCRISIKTRVGKDSPQEWEQILAIYEKYPLSELIIHPRIQKEFYKGTPHMEAYEAAYRIKNCSICYNGDMFWKEEIENFWKRFPNTDAMMLGRGILRDPCLYEKLFESEEMDASVWKQKVRSFHDALLDAYIEEMSGDRNVLFKMKELWFYLWESFDGSKKLIKKLKKSGSVSEYLRVVEEIFMQD